MFRILKFITVFILVFIICGIASSYYPDKSVEELKQKYALNNSNFMDIDGMPAHYVDEGLANDTIPLVLVHGTGSNLRTWDNWVQTISVKHRIIRMDLPAYGLTGPNKNHDYSAKSYVSFLHQLLSKLKVKNCYLAGNSLGGKIAWEYALAYPEEVKKLILIDAAGYPMTSRKKPFVFRLAENPILSKIFLKITPKFIIEKSLKDVYTDDTKVTQALIDQYHDMATRVGNREAFLSRKNVGFGNNYLQIPTIKLPTLILWGEDDNWIKVDNAYKFQKDLPNDTLIIYKNVGHVPMEESPQKTAQDVLMFLEK
jgi:pimeloyl-ACP methyl ester carboxylesterase